MQTLEDKVKALTRLRVYMLVESTNPEVSRDIGEFFAAALSRPLEIRSEGLNIALTFLWSLVNRVATQLEEMGEAVVDVVFERGKTLIVTKGGYAISVVVKMRHNQYVAEVEGIVEVEESPFKVEDF
ncbi:hypothetical protein [Pyrobaculum calidifontis]|uniref:Uncharacterized protein n=1 Tax=Pyrobaculum calidifontis (strain DSM 21063 / JCM 11548 / VA1) TaxID=410359 RepID=A3MY35_PYRCJ|nr:hypothetical protein [Pyrobaculum calidifontis]ABO09552.1 conserved hypothetical protein [Pyrobaculum calidifontis JCM 11548]